MREYEEANRYYDRALQLSPDVKDAYLEKAKNLLLWKGNTQEARRILDEGRRLGKAGIEGEGLNASSYYVEVLDGRFDAADQFLNRMKSPEGLSDQFQYYPTVLLRAELESRRGNRTRAAAYYDSARTYLEERQKINPQDERLYSSLGLAYAGLGRKDDAVRSGLRGVELLSVEKEAWRGSYRLLDLAKIYVMVADREKAIDVLEKLLGIPSDVSAVWLKIDPFWIPLRDHERFQKLIGGA